MAHRTAYHWNKLNRYFADNPKNTSTDNKAVQAIFGYVSTENKPDIKRGNIMISDVFLPTEQSQEKLINHVAIDRFTGGSMDGALFTEKVINGRSISFRLTIDVLKDAIKDGTVRQAFEAALKDITRGLLPLGGGVNRGNGMFTGTIDPQID